MNVSVRQLNILNKKETIIELRSQYHLCMSWHIVVRIGNTYECQCKKTKYPK
jgi:hypothetical protein